MTKSYPIWNKITACIYKSSKCYGVKDDGTNEILIGTSKSNSHEFVKTRVTHKKHDDGTRTYHFYIDNQLYKTATLQGREIDIKIHELYIVGGVTEHKLDDEISIKHKLTN
jgi:hypothetical protein|tara:strand:- start:1015 stop:1347 length:333 start_codon:yes stop_codon:yes gene_type:complete